MNFDLVLAFIHKLIEVVLRDEGLTEKNVDEYMKLIEIVFHWTKAKNIDKIIENGFKLPGNNQGFSIGGPKS